MFTFISSISVDLEVLQMGDRGLEPHVLNKDFSWGQIRPTIRILSMADNKMGGINGTLFIRDNSCYYYGYIVAF